jgi:hypothetical protein
MIFMLVAVVTAFFGLMVTLQSFLNHRVWQPYLYALLAGAIALVVLWYKDVRP